MDAHELDSDPREARANDLYWDSDASVNDIADDLDLSKGTLYGLIRPLPSGYPCPQCGAELHYANRTARDKGYLACPECGLEEEEELVREALEQDRGRGAAASSGADDALANRMLLGTALLGAAAGLLVLRWMKKR